MSSPAPGKAEPQKEDYLFNVAEKSFKEGGYKKAFLLFESLSYDGHVESTLYLARMYERGLGVVKSTSEALKIYKLAARLGSDSGKKAVARLTKQKPVKKKRFSSKPGSRSQMYLEAGAARRDGDFDVAYEILKPMAAKKDTRAMMMLASLLYQEGRGDKKNVKEAFELYLTLANSGSHQAQMMLSGMYRWGAGVKKNLPEAVRLLKESTKNGNRYAPHHLAVMYERGVGVPKDKEKALKLYKLSADRGYDWGKKAYERLSKE